MGTMANEAGPAAVGSDDLVGRDRELATIRELLGALRLVTIVGTGGVGKSRLAAAAASQHGLPGAVSVCELISVPLPGGVAGAMAESLGFPSFDAAAVGLAGHRRLLLLDNTEHVLDAAAEATERLLATCEGVTVLSTGREPLEIAGERVVVLEPLELPATDDPEVVAASPAVQLFLSRARAAGAGVAMDAPTARTVAAICRRLDGLPLAIELAAARARSLSPADILRHLDRRFDLLARRRPRGPERHRSLETAIAWSHERLDPPTRGFFDRLGAFCGPFTAQAATRVAGQPGEDPLVTLERLDTLVSRSLVRTSVRSGRTWYELLESLRAYARERLDDAGELTRCDERCVDYYVEVAGSIRRAGEKAWSVETFVDLLAAQLNLQDAVRSCLEHDTEPDRAFQLFLPLWGIVHNGRADVVWALGTALLERWPDRRHPGWGAVAATTATAAVVLGHQHEARNLAEAAVSDGVDAAATVMGARAMYLVCNVSGDHEEALRWVREGIAGAQVASIEPMKVELEVFLALATYRVDGITPAIEQARLAHQRAHSTSTPILQAWADLALGSLVVLDDPGAGADLLRQAVDTAIAAGYPWGLGTGRRALGALALVDGDLPGARQELAASLDVFAAIGHVAEVQATLRWIAALLLAEGRDEEARQVCPPHEHPALPIVDVLDSVFLDERLSSLDLTARTYHLDEAVDIARSATSGAVERESLAPVAESTRPPESRMQREGGVWALSFDGTTIRLPDTKGLQDLATLLAQPGREVAAGELMGAAVDSPDLGDVLDASARRAYELRIIELQAELDEAEAFADSARAARGREEFEQLVDALAAGTGLSGRARRSGGSADRARSAVTWRIRAAIRRITDLHPTLGAHLDDTIRTGRWCAYAPIDDPVWTVVV